MVEQFGSDLTTIIRDLTRRIEKLESGQRAGPGLTIGQASGAFLLPSAATPGTPAGGGYLFASGGTPYWKDSSGSAYPLTPAPPVTPGPAPQYPGSFDSPATIGGTPTASNYNDLRADAAMLQVCLRSVIESGRTVPIWDTV
ncbi:hypothetical protein [Streptosporangium sp. KLBMP 9127]|nr:hypothetical protein [Streptosporangium sp. KLBMP 9127]